MNCVLFVYIFESGLDILDWLIADFLLYEFLRFSSFEFDCLKERFFINW